MPMTNLIGLIVQFENNQPDSFACTGLKLKFVDYFLSALLALAGKFLVLQDFNSCHIYSLS